MKSMKCPEKQKAVIISNDETTCYEPKTEECKACQFNKEIQEEP